jgi:hypothetical protein
MNIAQNQLHQQPKQNRLFYIKQQPQQQSNDENGLQYKIVHLKFRIEPQQGSNLRLFFYIKSQFFKLNLKFNTPFKL